MGERGEGAGGEEEGGVAEAADGGGECLSFSKRFDEDDERVNEGYEGESQYGEGAVETVGGAAL